MDSQRGVGGAADGSPAPHDQYCGDQEADSGAADCRGADAGEVEEKTREQNGDEHAGAEAAADGDVLHVDLRLPFVHRRMITPQRSDPAADAPQSARRHIRYRMDGPSSASNGYADLSIAVRAHGVG